MPAIALDAGDRAPDVASKRLDDPAHSIAVADARGKVAYVDFWASWCVPCRLSMPTLESLYKRNAARGFVVIGVNKDVSAADAERFRKRVAVSFPLATDGDDAWARAFAVKAMPSGYLVDRRGVVRYVHRGFTEETGAALEKEVEMLLKEPS